MLGISLGQCIKNDITAHTSFSWTPNSILTYLGMQLITPSSRLLYINFNNLLSKLQKTVQDLQHTPVSWAGKIALAKMYLLQHVLYMFPTISIPFLNKQLLKLQSIITTFIWGGKRSRLKSNTLCKPVSLEGWVHRTSWHHQCHHQDMESHYIKL